MSREPQDDLFGYPDAPGWRDPETSREAAEIIAPRVRTLRRLTYDFICEHPGYTADEIAKALNKPTRTIQPRVSELRRMRLIVNDGRRRTPAGATAHLWRRRT